MKTCYMCDRQATSREHVPPKCFFPEKGELSPERDYRKNLITVPSCDAHNLSKSKDDEYLLAVVLSYFENNAIAQGHFIKKMLRALKRRPSLFHLFANLRPATVDGKPTAVFEVDRKRFDRSVACMARGLHFCHYGEKWEDPIDVFTIEPVMRLGNYEEINREFRRLSCETTGLLENERRFGDNQEVFYYQICREEQPKGLLVRIVFYEGFSVIALSSQLLEQKTSDA
jgi:hypothetical protein